MLLCWVSVGWLMVLLWLVWGCGCCRAAGGGGCWRAAGGGGGNGFFACRNSRFDMATTMEKNWTRRTLNKTDFNNVRVNSFLWAWIFQEVLAPAPVSYQINDQHTLMVTSRLNNRVEVVLAFSVALAPGNESFQRWATTELERLQTININ